MTAIIVATAVACGLMAGVFFDFSTFAMRGLRALPPRQGLEAMQAMNVTAVEPPLMLALFGTALGSVVVGVDAVLGLDEPGAWWALAGAALYLGGVLVLTAVYHVPRNNALAAVDPADPDAEAAWLRYATGWTAWNHVRTVAPLAAAAALTIAAVLR